MKRQLNYPFRIIGAIILLVFIMIEEIVLSPLKKIKIVFIENTIKRLSAFWTIALLGILKTIEGGLKFALPVFADSPAILSSIIFLDGFLGFISMNIIIHGRENLMSYRWYRIVNIFIYRRKKEIKQTEFYIKTKRYAHKMREKIITYFSRFRIWIFGNQRGIFFNLKRYVKFGIRRYKQKTRRKTTEKI